MSALGGNPQGDSVPMEERIAAIRERVERAKFVVASRSAGLAVDLLLNQDIPWLLARLAACAAESEAASDAYKAGYRRAQEAAVLADEERAAGPREARLREAEPIVVTQRENGCYAACVASLTGIPLDDLPHPSPDEEFTREAWTTYRNTLNRFLRERGWWRAWIPADTPPLGYAIAHGDGPRGMGHCCVSRGAAIVMDPHPNGGGLVSVEGYEVLVRCAALASPPPDETGVADAGASGGTQAADRDDEGPPACGRRDPR